MVRRASSVERSPGDPVVWATFLYALSVEAGNLSAMIKCDTWISRMAREHGMIEPFTPDQVRFRQAEPGRPTGVHMRAVMDELSAQENAPRIISYGLSSMGYDLRVADEYLVCRPGEGIVDPKDNRPEEYDRVEGLGSCVVPPNSFALARSVERFKIPRDVQGVVLGKSTYARCGIIVNCTPLEPEWEGFITLEISNTQPRPARIYSGEGLCQVLFFQSDQPCAVSYKDRGGKYQGQTAEIVLPRM